MSAIFKAKFNPEALQSFKLAALKETQDMFLLDIVPEAVKNSPVTPEGLARNIEQRKKRPGGTGVNRRSIDAEVELKEDGIHAELFTQSGYGAYLELGTSKMRAQPYLYPAFVKFIGDLQGRIKARNK